MSLKAECSWLVLAVTTAWAAAAAAGNGLKCPSSSVQIGGRCYWLSPTSHTFEGCQHDVCGPAGGTLACLRPEDNGALAWRLKATFKGENDFLLAWIGFTDAGQQDWTWINGCQAGTTHWLPGEPNDDCGGEDCATITATGAWMDVSCRLRLRCLCEYPGSVTAVYNRSVPYLRDDTCYADCGDLTKWCSAWPFTRLYDVDDDLCHWEDTGGVLRGRGVSECAARVAAHGECGSVFTYSVGRCRCNPPKGLHANCTYREPSVASDIFRLEPGGAQLIHNGQRCVYAIDVDSDYFQTLKPATTWKDMARLWLRAAVMWLVVGVPSVLVMSCIVCRMCSCSAIDTAGDGSWDDKSAGQGGGHAYGNLIDTEEDGASDLVNKWVVRGALGSVVYGLALLALAVSLAAHVAGSEKSMVFELVESFVMAMSKASVARAANMVHRLLSPTARQIVGPWILVVALAKFLMALTAFGGAAFFAILASGDYESICFAMYLFRWSLLLALPLQCLSGYSLWRIQARAAPYAGAMARAGGWSNVLVLGNFGAGLGVWVGGYLNCVHELAEGIIVTFFALAALAQLLAGVALLVVNKRIKDYWGRPSQNSDSVPADWIGRGGEPEDL